MELGAFSDQIHLIAGLPIPLCCFNHAPNCRSFQAEADYGFCAAKKQTYYGFHGHLIISATGVQLNIDILTYPFRDNSCYTAAYRENLI